MNQQPRILAALRASYAVYHCGMTINYLAAKCHADRMTVRHALDVLSANGDVILRGTRPLRAWPTGAANMTPVIDSGPDAAR